MGAAAVPIMAATSVLGYSESRRARRDQREEEERQRKEQQEAEQKEFDEKLQAKRDTYQDTRAAIKRSRTRGRTSTVLDKSDRLG